MMLTTASLQLRPAAVCKPARASSMASKAPLRRAIVLQASKKDGEKEESKTIVDQVKEAASSAFSRAQDINLEMHKHQPADEGEFIDVEAEESDARKKLKREFMKKQDEKTDSAGGSPLQH